MSCLQSIAPTAAFKEYAGQLFIKDLRPVFISILYMSGHVFIPHFLYFIVQIKVKFPIHNCPEFRHDISRGPTAYCVSSVPAILGCIFFWRSSKKIKVLFACKKPFCPFPVMTELIVPLQGLANGEVSNSVISFNG